MDVVFGFCGVGGAEYGGSIGKVENVEMSNGKQIIKCNCG